MNARHVYFAIGLIALMLLFGYVRDLGKRAGLPASQVALLERLALFA